jgi:hypothetical protein
VMRIDDEVLLCLSLFHIKYNSSTMTMILYHTLGVSTVGGTTRLNIVGEGIGDGTQHWSESYSICLEQIYIISLPLLLHRVTFIWLTKI